MILFLSAILMLASYSAIAENDKDTEGIKVMSYNIRYGSAEDGPNSWNYRCPATVEMIEDQKPDVFGVQEALYYQISFIEENCSEYKSVGVGRDDGKKAGEHMSVFWNTKTISMLKWGTLWLSETPDKPSLGWDAACCRTATWVLMKDKRTGRKFYFVNTHLDHVGREAQKNGLKLIVDKLVEINQDNYPMILTGDFNVTSDDCVLCDLDSKMTSARRSALKTDDKGTYNNWGKSSLAIDYIYYSGFSSCPEFHTVTDAYAKRAFVSDHYPITATLIF